MKLSGRTMCPGAIAIAVLTLLIAAPVRCDAERLPITTYGPPHGLPGTFLEHVTRDSRGFVWISTRDGLSRFDGVRFVTYGVEHGLPNPTINFLLETRAGDYWVATNGGGLCRMDAGAPMPAASTPSSTDVAGARGDRVKLFTCYRVGGTDATNQINALHEDARGRVWIGSDGGLFRIDSPRGDVRVDAVPLEIPFGRVPGVHTIRQDARGVVWLGLSWGLVRIGPDDGRTHYSIRASAAGDNIYAILFDVDGRLWLGHQTGLIVTRPIEPARETLHGAIPTQSLVDPSRTLPQTTPARLPERIGETLWREMPRDERDIGGRDVGGPVHALHATPDDHIWIGTANGLIEFDRQRFRGYSAGDGLSDTFIMSLATDAEGNLWAATMAGGAMKVTRNGFLSYDTRDGLGDAGVHAIFEDRAGTLLVVSGDWLVNRFDGRRFTYGRPRLPPDVRRSWNSQVAFLDSTDRWWILTNAHLSRLPTGSTGSPAARVDGLTPSIVQPDVTVDRLFEDRRGDVWVGLRFIGPYRLMLWQRATDTLRLWTEADGMPAVAPTAFAEDAAGHVWIGLQNGEFLRHADGRFTRFPAPRGVGGAITSLCRDEDGRVWAGSNRDGVIRIDVPDGAQPRFTVYSKAEGLGSNNVRSVVADRWGRIYAGTARGVDRIDPETNRIQHYTTGDGLPSGFVNVAYRDRAGALWFGSLKGLSRLRPEPVERRDPPRVFIGGVRAAGTPHVMSHLGQTDVSGLTLRPGEGQLQIDFFGIALGVGESLRYQYRLDGADDRDRWSDATDERTVHYSRLPPRSYRFQVRAVRADGTPSQRAATVAFVVQPALWQRAWFQALAAALIALAAYAAYRVRVGRLLALERVRSRIAGDLHDDIGATLAQIAVLSEVVQRQIDGADAPLRAPVSRIADAAREAIASMSDIVWAINPQKDSLHEMVRRMRRFAGEVLPARGIAFRITAPESDVRLGADERRHIYLIFKEALNNVLRHAQCTEVDITLRLHQRRLSLEVADNGRGFTQPSLSDGHGLTSMTRRARALGGTLEIVSGNGRPGTVVTTSIPLGRVA